MRTALDKLTAICCKHARPSGKYWHPRGRGRGSDLKPANLFLTVRPDGTPLIKIVDFGIAKDASSASFHRTRTDAVMGSPGYMSPEQLRSTRIANARSDIWALGVILYELSSGRPPFIAESLTELALRVATDPTPLRGAPPGFEHVVHCCLEKDPARRFQDVAQLASALAPFGGPTLRDRALGVARVLSAAPDGKLSAPVVAATAAPTTLGASAAGLERTPRDRSRWGIALAGLGIVTLASVAVVELRGGDAPVKPVAAPSAPPPRPLDAAIQSASAPSPAAVPHAAEPEGAAIPVDAAVPVDATRASDAAAPVDAASRPHAAPPARKATRPRTTPHAGSDDDVGGSRL